MKIIKSIKELVDLRKSFNSKKKIGFVPTMGALHQGHLSLVSKSKKQNDVTIVSIFVNPTQFSKNEDLSKYPKPIENDIKILKSFQVDILFIPSYNNIYKKDFSIWIFSDKYTNILCGKYRKNHFKGALTIVLKLFNIVNPNNAYFGKKDFQQCFLIKKMVTDLNLNIKINPVPIVREKSGLALSSRNSYLKIEQKEDASQIYKSLRSAKDDFKKNRIESPTLLINSIKKKLNNINIKIQYLEIRDSHNLSIVKKCNNKSIIFFAGFIGKTRLIDNIQLN